MAAGKKFCRFTQMLYAYKAVTNRDILRQKDYTWDRRNPGYLSHAYQGGVWPMPQIKNAPPRLPPCERSALWRISTDWQANQKPANH
jgi:hypothetical protein